MVSAEFAYLQNGKISIKEIIEMEFLCCELTKVKEIILFQTMSRQNKPKLADVGVKPKHIPARDWQ